MKPLIFVGLGGFIGSVTRYLTSVYITRMMGSGFPWGTMTANIVGCLLIGLISGMIIDREFSWPFREFFIVGVLGGFTTFSSFGLETWNLLKSGATTSAVAYVGLSLLLGLIAVAAGYSISRQLI